MLTYLLHLWCWVRGHSPGEWHSHLGNPPVAFPEAGIQIKGIWSHTHCRRCGEHMTKWEGPTTGGICSDFRDPDGNCLKDDCPRRSVCLIAALGWPPDWSDVKVIPDGYEIGPYPHDP